MKLADLIVTLLPHDRRFTGACQSPRPSIPEGTRARSRSSSYACLRVQIISTGEYDEAGDIALRLLGPVHGRSRRDAQATTLTLGSAG